MLEVEITGGAKVFVNKYGKGKNQKKMMTICIASKKVRDDEYINHYIPVNFSDKLRESVMDIDEAFDITIKEAWLSAYKDEDNHTHLVLFVNKAKIVEP